MSFSEEYAKLRKKRLGEEEKKIDSGSSFSERYAALKKKREEEEEEKPSSSLTQSTQTTMTSTDAISLWRSALNALDTAETDAQKQAIGDALKSMLGDNIPDRNSIKVVEDNSGVFKSSSLWDDGYQVGDITRTIGSSANDLGVSFLEGVSQPVEGLTDLLLHGTAELIDLFGGDEAADALRDWTSVNHVQKAAQWYRDFTGKGDESALGDFSRNIGSGLGQIADMILLGELGAAAGWGSKAIGAANTGFLGLSSMGSGIGEALQGGATKGEAWGYGALQGAVEAGSEMIFGGLGKGLKVLGLGKGLTSIDDQIAKKISSGISNKFFKSLTQAGVKASAEGLEEVLAGIGTAAAKKLTYLSEEEFGQLLEDENLWESFLSGAIVSGIAQMGDVANSTQTGRDMITGLTKNEQAVVDKVYENELSNLTKQQDKVTGREKSKLYDTVIERMEKGQLSTDDIEAVLGGEDYKAYKDILDKETALEDKKKALQEEQMRLREERQKLAEEYTPLNNKAWNERSGEEYDRMDEIDQRIEEIKNRNAEIKTELKDIDSKLNDETAQGQKKSQKAQLSQKVYEMSKSDRLVESYLENVRKTQKFEADLSKYSKTQKAFVQKAMDSGVLNNSSTTHELVDLMANIHEQKGVDFDFTNSEKLKESGFSLEGAEINGFVNGKNVTVNVNAKKALNSVVGHEVAHVLEGSQMYDALAEVVETYAKTKGEYDARLAQIKKLYTGKEGYTGTDADAKFRKEVVADLVGDYIFTDKAFVQNLSTNRNVFQKIYDEIKYLYNVATAGSEQKRQLEKAKKIFAQVWRETKNTTAEGGTKYSYSKPNFTKDEWSIVNRKRFSEFYNPKYDLDTDRKWMYFNEKGMSGFAIYSKTDPDDPTLLHWSRGKSASKDYEKISLFLEGGKNANSGRTAIDRLLADIKHNERIGSNGISYAEGSLPSIENVPVSFGTSGSNRRGDYGDGAENLRAEEITEYNKEASENSDASSVTFSNDYATIRNFMKEGDTGERDSDIQYSLSGNIDKYSEPFYSNMAIVVDGVKQDKLGASSVVNMLRGKGVKAEEIKWSGIEAWLDGKKSVTKAELQEFVKGSQLQIDEVVLDDGENSVISYTDDELQRLDELQDQYQQRMDQARALWQEAYGEEIPWDIEFADDSSAAISREIIRRNGGVRDFAGVDALSEAEQTLYTEVCQNLHVTDLWIAQIRDRAEARQKNTSKTHWSDYKLKGGENYREYMFKLPGSDYRNQAMDVHWKGETGVLAHARVQDFNTENGKMLFIEEIQSDWHNEGQKSGYRKANQKTQEQLRRESEKAYESFYSAVEKMVYDNAKWEDDNAVYYVHPVVVAEMFEGNESHFSKYGFTNKQIESIRSMVAAEAERKAQLQEAPTERSAPDAPFSKTYQEYVLKRMIREAAEKGYDVIGWTTADIQSDRWSEDYTEGYRIEYDQDIPKFLNKYGKKWGTKVGKTVLENGTEVWSVAITDEMKQSVLYEGQPMYSLSETDTEDIAPIGWNVRGEDVAFDAPMATTSEAVEGSVSEEISGEEIAPLNAETVAVATEEVPAAEMKPPVAKPARQPGKSEKERKWYGTSTASEAVDGAVTPDDIPDEVRYYQPIPNKKTLGNANDMLELHGYDQSLADFKSKMRNNKVSLDDIALGERLIQEAVKKGDTKTATDLIMDISILGTELGQKVQALSIIKRLTPEGQLKMLTKAVERGKTKGDKAYKGVEITEEDAKIITDVYNADGTFDQKELTEAVETVKQRIADRMKIGAMDYVNEWRYLSMLGNPKTHIRNIVSNIAMSGTRAVKNAVARTIEGIAPIKERTKTWKQATDFVKDYAKQATMEEYSAAKDGKYSDDMSLKSKRKVLKGVAGKAADINSALLSWEDKVFSKSAYRSSLQEYLTANGIKTEADLQSNPQLVAKAKAYAMQQAKEATFQQDSYIASKISEIERKNPLFNIAIGSTLPFKKTPINIAKTAAAYSPLGFARNIYDAVQVAKGEMEASTAVDHLAQTLTGSSLALIGYFLAQAGILNGAGDDDKEGNYDYQLGKQSYSLNFNGDTYSLSWLSPVAMPLFGGANAYEQLVEGKEWNVDVVVKTLAQTLDPMSEMSFLSSLDSVLSSYDSGIQKFVGIFETAAQSYVGQFIPTLSSQVAAATDDTKRSTKASADSGFKFGDSLMNQIKYKIPGLRQTLEPTTDVWGNEVKQTEDDGIRTIESFFAPWSKRNGIGTTVDEEIKELYSQTGDTGLIPTIPNSYLNYGGEKYNMSAEDYTQYKKLYGQTAYGLLDTLFEMDTYQNASAEERADMVNKVYDYAREEAKREYFEKQGVDYTNATKDGEKYYKEEPIKGAIDMDMALDEYKFFVDSPGKYSVAVAVGGYEKYTGYKDSLNDIKSDKNANGDSVSGSRKKKVVEYINSLDASFGEKIILFKSEYPADDRYNRQIVEYLNSREDLSAEDIRTILTELDFKVDEEGYVTWD